jgi:hypothetical protein
MTSDCRDVARRKVYSGMNIPAVGYRRIRRAGTNAPSGRFRATIGFGNPILARRKPERATGGVYMRLPSNRLLQSKFGQIWRTIPVYWIFREIVQWGRWATKNFHPCPRTPVVDAKPQSMKHS